MAQLVEFLATWGTWLAAVSTLLMGLGCVAVARFSRPVQRLRLAELTLGGLGVWAVLTCVPLPRYDLSASVRHVQATLSAAITADRAKNEATANRLVGDESIRPDSRRSETPIMPAQRGTEASANQLVDRKEFADKARPEAPGLPAEAVFPTGARPRPTETRPGFETPAAQSDRAIGAATSLRARVATQSTEETLSTPAIPRQSVVAKTAQATSGLSPSPLVAHWWSPARSAVAVYLGGVGLLAAWLVLGRCLLSRLVAAGRPAKGWLATLYLELAEGQAPARLIVSPQCARPMSFGIVSPTIVLPSAWCRRGNREALVPVLLHELAHVRRGDAWGHHLFNLFLPVLYFQPLYWWLRRTAQLAREVLADDWAARRTSASEYVQQLMVLVRRSESRQAGSMLVVGVFGSSSHFYRRMNMLLLRREQPLAARCSPVWRTVWSILVLVVVALAAGAGGVPAKSAFDPAEMSFSRAPAVRLLVSTLTANNDESESDLADELAAELAALESDDEDEDNEEGDEDEADDDEASELAEDEAERAEEEAERAAEAAQEVAERAEEEAERVAEEAEEAEEAAEEEAERISEEAERAAESAAEEAEAAAEDAARQLEAELEQEIISATEQAEHAKAAAAEAVEFLKQHAAEADESATSGIDNLKDQLQNLLSHAVEHGLDEALGELESELKELNVPEERFAELLDQVRHKARESSGQLGSGVDELNKAVDQISALAKERIAATEGTLKELLEQHLTSDEAREKILDQFRHYKEEAGAMVDQARARLKESRAQVEEAQRAAEGAKKDALKIRRQAEDETKELIQRKLREQPSPSDQPQAHTEDVKKLLHELEHAKQAVAQAKKEAARAKEDAKVLADQARREVAREKDEAIKIAVEAQQREARQQDERAQENQQVAERRRAEAAERVAQRAAQRRAGRAEPGETPEIRSGIANNLLDFAEKYRQLSRAAAIHRSLMAKSKERLAELAAQATNEPEKVADAKRDVEANAENVKSWEQQFGFLKSLLEIELEAAQEELAFAQEDLDRLNDLVKSGAASAEEQRRARRDLSRARRTVRLLETIRKGSQ